MTPSQILRQQILAMQANAPMADFTSRAVIVSNLVFLHGIMTASERLMARSITKCYSPVLRSYLTEHLEEERDHAKWMADDLKDEGVDISLPSIPAMELAGSMYYLIEHVNPVCLLGYMAVLEGFPANLEFVAELEKVHGKKLLRCLRYHAENDLEHRKELFNIIDKMDSPLVVHAATYTQLKMNQFGNHLAGL